MGFNKPSTTEVQTKDLRRINALGNKLASYVDDPYLDEIQQLVRKMLQLDRKQHDTMD